jgi:hypothetical protein
LDDEHVTWNWGRPLIVAFVLSCGIGCPAPPEAATVSDPVWSTRFLREIAAEPGPPTVTIQRLIPGEGMMFAGRKAVSAWFVLEPGRNTELLSLLADKTSFTATGRSQSPCGAQVGFRIQRDTEWIIAVFDCGRLFWEDNELIAATSPTLSSLMARLAAEVFPCDWQRLDPLDAEVCTPAGANVSRAPSFFDVSTPEAACPNIKIIALDSASRQVVQTAGSASVACIHDGKPACAELCETIRPVPRPTRASSSIDEAVISFSVSGGMSGGSVARIAVWSDGTVELTRFRCPSARTTRAEYTVRTTMSAGALALLLLRLKQSGIAKAIGSHEAILDGFRQSLRVTIDGVTYQAGAYGEPTSQPLKDSIAVIHEYVGIPRCE